MHFSIPDTTEISAKKSSNQHSYTLFNLYINGIHHCSLRYSQLRTFNDDLQRLHASLVTNNQPFPPRKLFSLSVREIDERRAFLERYLQSIVQNKSLISSVYFTEFFLNAQRETFLHENHTLAKVNFPIYLLNQHEILLEHISPIDNTSKLLDACVTKIQLENEYLSYFSLFLYEQILNQMNIIRPLFSFESPYLSLKKAQKSHENYCLVFKKSYWDLNYDLQLTDNRRTRNLLFIQSQYDIEQNEEFYSIDLHQQFDLLHKNNSFKEYILLARTLKFYGYIILKQCEILYPINDLTTQKLSQCIVAIGNNELICYLNNNQEKLVKEISFKVTRTRCWKVNWTKQDMNIGFEYLIKKDILQWINIHTQQAPLISTCLQSMVDEILAKKDGAIRPASVLEISNENNNNIKSNGLKKRTKLDLDRLNNNELFDKGDGDDDL